jgi:putative acetyltransferase
VLSHSSGLENSYGQDYAAPQQKYNAAIVRDEPLGHGIFKIDRLYGHMTSSFMLRPATEVDHDTIAQVWHASASLPGVGPAVMPSEAELRQRLRVEFESGWDVTVAISGDEIVGFVAIKPKQAVLAELFVRPGALGGGIGQRLLAHAIAAMPDGFTLYTRSGNTRATRFYEKAGLARLREGIHPRSGDPIVYYGWQSS